MNSLLPLFLVWCALGYTEGEKNERVDSDEVLGTGAPVDTVPEGRGLLYQQFWAT